MKTTRRAFIKKINWTLAGILGMMGFAGCDKIFTKEEYGSPYAEYTIKGAVVNKTTKKPIEGIRVGYGCDSCPVPEYGVPSAPYQLKSHVLTNAKGEFKLTDKFFPENYKILPVVVEDIDGEKNGSFKSETLQVNFKDAVHSGKPKSWYHGEYTVTVNVELSEKENE